MRTAWREELPSHLRLGTSSFAWAEWHGPFYPVGLPAAERIGWYATQFDTVEIDATWYAMPSASLVSGWALKTPETFTFALKVPKQITHEAGLEGTDAATAQFLEVTERLGPRRGPLLLQFQYLARSKDAHEWAYGDDFRRRLRAWLARWGGRAPWVVEVRNPEWLSPVLLQLLRDYRVPLALTAFPTMPGPTEWLEGELDPLTGDFAYVRFLGNHYALDRLNDKLVAAGEKPPGFCELIVDREEELRGWVDALLPVVTRMRTWAYCNNHYAGFGPGSARMFSQLWNRIHG